MDSSIRVPKDCTSINEAYTRIEQSKGALTTIVLGPGDHVVKGGGYLNIKCPVNIVGSRDVLDKSKIVVVGGFYITANGLLSLNFTYSKNAFPSCILYTYPSNNDL